MSSFPYKLHQLLTDIEGNEELSSIISWLPNGDGFRIHQPVVFETVLLKKYFPRQSKIKSFKRQVQYYGFENLGRGSYSHPSFVRGKRSLCGKIIHKLPMKNLKKTAAAASADALTQNLKTASRSMIPSPTTTASLTSNNHPMVRKVSWEHQMMPLPVLSTLAAYPHHHQVIPHKALSTAMPMFQSSPQATMNFQQQAMMQEYLKMLLLSR